MHACTATLLLPLFFLVHHSHLSHLPDAYSCMFLHPQALEEAKNAANLERQLSRQRETQLGPDQLNFDLTFAVSHCSTCLGHVAQSFSAVSLCVCVFLRLC